jgi:ureidoglycolate lyase
MADRIIEAQALTPEAFAPFGDVIQTAGHSSRWINQGTSQRYDDLARLDLVADGGRPMLSIFRARAQSLPFTVGALERHPLSSQSFYPLDGCPFLVVVAVEGHQPVGQRILAFLSTGRQGINYRRNTWHHALIALERTCDFLVIDRDGPESNCEELEVDTETVRVVTPQTGVRR